MKSKQYGIRLPEPLAKRVDARAAEEDRTVSMLVRRALADYLSGERVSPEVLGYVRFLQRLSPEDRALVRALFHRLGYPEDSTTASGTRGK